MAAAWTGTRAKRWRRSVRKALVGDTIDALVQQVVAAARPGDHIVCMSNGGFGGIHARLLQALGTRFERN